MNNSERNAIDKTIAKALGWTNLHDGLLGPKGVPPEPNDTAGDTYVPSFTTDIADCIAAANALVHAPWRWGISGRVIKVGKDGSQDVTEIEAMILRTDTFKSDEDIRRCAGTPAMALTLVLTEWIKRNG